jgi:hypothetical protein
MLIQGLPNELTLQEKELQHLSIHGPPSFLLLALLPRFQRLKTVRLGDDRHPSIVVYNVTELWRDEVVQNHFKFNAPPTITFSSREDSMREFA